MNPPINIPTNPAYRYHKAPDPNGPVYTPNIYQLELEINYNCGLGCNNCNRLTQIEAGNLSQMITVKQLDDMLKESVALGHKWLKMKFIGGEAMIHPNFWEMLDLVCAYQQSFSPELKIHIATHGQGEFARKCILRLNAERRPNVIIENTNKTTNIRPEFDTMTVAPKDLRPEFNQPGYQYRGCWIPHWVGLGFNYQGFYVCGPGAGIDRIFDLGLMIAKLKTILDDAKNGSPGLIGQYNPLCALCGHYAPLNGVKTTLISPTWHKAMVKYEKRQEARLALKHAYSPSQKHSLVVLGQGTALRKSEKTVIKLPPASDTGGLPPMRFKFNK